MRPPPLFQNHRGFSSFFRQIDLHELYITLGSGLAASPFPRPPRSKPPGFQSSRICFSKLAMIDSRYASSSGIRLSSAIFKPSLGRFLLIKAVANRATGSRSNASNAGRTNGSNRRSRCKRTVNASFNRSKKNEPVLAFGAERLLLEFKGLRSKGRGPRCANLAIHGGEQLVQVIGLSGGDRRNITALNSGVKQLETGAQS